MKISYAWYSVKQAKLCGSVRYRTADGVVVECTSITNSMDRSALKWSDLEFVSEVVEFVERVSDGEFDGFDKLTLGEQITRLGEIIQKQLADKEEEKKWN